MASRTSAAAAADEGSDSGWHALTMRAHDGLELFARDYGPRDSGAVPALCLAGLTRNSRDFHELALALSRDARAPRRVLCPDYRGRGRSARDRRWRNYSIPVELADTLDLLVAAGIERAGIVGTSRGGLIAMALAAARPGAVAGVVLNDIGPEISGTGLARIKSYVGSIPEQPDWRSAARFLRRMAGDAFPGRNEEAWLTQARKIFVERDGRIVPDFDPGLARTLDSVDLTRPLPTLWHQFDALAGVPVLVLRGTNSDVLTADAARRMAAHHPDCTLVEVPFAGHAPLLVDDASLRTVAEFFRRLDRRAAG